LAYGALIAAIGDPADLVAKDLEVYAGDAPPPGYSLDSEVEGVVREADARGWGRFHLVGYSGGGAASLAVAARHPERLLSLGLLEPAWAGNWDWSPEEKAFWDAQDRMLDGPEDQFMGSFIRLALRPGVEPPPRPDGPPPPWMATRPGGIRAFIETFKTYDLDRDALRGFDRPVYCALGALSNPAQYGAIAQRLARVFPDFTLETFDERHHFDPPHRVEAERLAASLLRIWDRAGS
jgi:pimeloyl-ACP methyl ester carboxylesterase